MTLVLLDTVSLLGLAMALEAPVEDFLRPCTWWKGLQATSKACEVGNERSIGVLPPASEASTAMLLDKKEGGERIGSQPGVVSEADAMQVLLVFQSVMTLTYRYNLWCRHSTRTFCTFIHMYVHTSLFPYVCRYINTVLYAVYCKYVCTTLYCWADSSFILHLPLLCTCYYPMLYASAACTNSIIVSLSVHHMCNIAVFMRCPYMTG